MTVTAPPATLVWHRTVFTVSGLRDHVTFDERPAAEVEVRRQLTGAADLIPAGGDFGGCITWATEQVPDQLFDQVVDEYAAEPHRPSTAADWRLDRDQDFLLVEENTSGGFWLSSHPTATAASRYHDNQEYAEDWAVVELVNHTTGERFAAHRAAGRTTWRRTPS